ncbi:hypothetical protein [Bdellovibrio sp. HCB337]|uniref:hypothetical protein n=1 Tax=Bdellovibrio sp. HCB337 TaxID=3394358 RepID=UPI0039A5C27D
MKTILALLVVSGLSSQALAWGGRGHAAICETAVYLVKSPGLKDYLKNKPQMMGHLCNMPDFFWRSLPSEQTKLGNPTHFIDPEITGLKVTEIPLDFKKIVEDYTGKPNQFKKGATIYNVPSEFGSAWWRADQFYRRFLTFNNDLKAATPPKNPKEETDNDLPYNKAAFEMVVSLGLMGHFVGDISQPLHTTADYDGYATGHGGLHAYYEDQVVAEFDGDLQARVLKEARSMKNPKFLKPKTTVEKMRALSEISNEELKTLFKLDPVKTPSSVVNEKGMDIKKAAERESPAVGYKKFNKIMVTEMARASVLLANLWDEAYTEAGQPVLTASKIYKYPLTVDFVAPDYLPPAKDEPKK